MGVMVENESRPAQLEQEVLYFEASKLIDVAFAELWHVPECAEAITSTFLSRKPDDIRNLRDLHQVLFSKNKKTFRVKVESDPSILPLVDSELDSTTRMFVTVESTEATGEVQGFRLGVDNGREKRGNIETYVGDGPSKRILHTNTEQAVREVENFLITNFPPAA